MDDLLPIYASILRDICPCDKTEFPKKFNEKLGKFLSSPTKKTMDNHRTEITGKLFGMWVSDEHGIIRPSKRTYNLLEHRDQPTFFKEIAWNLQFPNGMDKIQTIKNRIRVRPCAFVLKFLTEASKRKIIPTKDEVAYYVLNNLDVLQGISDVGEILDVILHRRKNKTYCKVEHNTKNHSYYMQHISEILNIMELANLIRIERKNKTSLIRQNQKESKFINRLAKNWNKHPSFNIYRYDHDSLEDIKKMYCNWNSHYAKSVLDEDLLRTDAGTLLEMTKDIRNELTIPTDISPQRIGDEGETIVLNYEKRRVREFHPRLVNKVIYFGKQKGLGYDELIPILSNTS